MPEDNILPLETPEAPPPDPASLVNVVDQIPAEKQKEIAMEICVDYLTDDDSLTEWKEKREKWYKLWACIRDKKTNPWPGSSNVCIPMMATACNQFHARSYQSIFAAPGMVKTLPVAGNDVKRAKNVEDYMNWQTLNEMEEYEEVFDKLLQLLPINGTAFKKLFYSKELDRPVSEYISALDLILPYRTKSMETARRITHKLHLHYDELQMRDEMGLYSNFDEVQTTAVEEKKDSNQTTADEVVGSQVTKREEIPHLILESHKDYKLGDKREPFIFTVDFATQTLLRATKREYKEGADTKKINYFTDYHFIPNSEGFYSFGFGHFLEPLNEMANTAFNQIFDAGRLSNQPFGFYGRRAGIKKRKISLWPGAMTEVEDAKQVFFPNMQRVDAVLFQILGLIQQYTEQFTSTSEYLTGRESRGTKTPTASGTLAIIEQGLVTFAVMTKRIFRSLRKELRLLMLLNQIFIPDAKEYRVLGGRVAFKDVKAEDFKGVKDIIPIGDPSYASRTSRRQEAMEIYQIGMGNPLIVGTPGDKEGQGGSPPNIPAMHALFSSVLDTYDLKNKNEILPDLPDQPTPPEVENSMFMQGDYKSPVSGEDHRRHISVHMEFTKSPFYTAIPDEYKILLSQHLEETAQISYLDTQANQGLGGGAQDVPAG